MEMLQAREDLMEAIEAFLKKYDHIPPKDKCIALWRAEQKFLKIKQAFEEDQDQPEIVQELLLQLIHDLQVLDRIQPKQAEEKGTNKQVQKNKKKDFIYHDDDNDNDDYDEDIILSKNTDTFETSSPDAITISFPIEEPKDSLIMGNEEHNTIPEKESDEFIKSSVENLVLIPSESEATFDNEILEKDVFSNFPFELDIESISSDENPIYDEELEDMDGTNYLINSIIDFSPKIDPILEEFASELTLNNLIPSGIDEADFGPEGDIRLIEKLSYDNSSPRPPEELNSEDISEFFYAFPIPVEDSGLFLEKTKTLPELATFRFDIEEKNSSSTTTHANTSLPEYESFHFNLSDYSLFLADKSDSVSETFDDDSTKEVQVQIPNVLPTHPTICQDLDFTLSTNFSGSNLVVSFPSSGPLSPVLETLLPFSSENEDKVFNPGILVSKEEKSPHLLSHRGFKAR
ncbi:hypothetical protein Tco_0944360 [Tanacetum coccineum]